MIVPEKRHSLFERTRGVRHSHDEPAREIFEFSVELQIEIELVEAPLQGVVRVEELRVEEAIDGRVETVRYRLLNLLASAAKPRAPIEMSGALLIP